MRAHSLNHFKSIMAGKFFVAPADKNYFLARWARIHGFGDEFYWQSLQAIEKYLKASLVVNDITAKRYGHQITRLFEKHLDLFENETIRKFEKPKDVHSRYWDNETVPSFIKRINIQGDPDSRYGMVSWYHTPNDLFKLDQLVFRIRRLTVGLDWIIGLDWEVDEEFSKYNGNTLRKLIVDYPYHQIRPVINLPRYPTNLAGNALSDVLHAWNFSFVRDLEDLEKPAPSTVAPSIGPFENSYIYLLWEYIHHDGSKDDPYIVDGIKWLTGHVSLGKPTEDAFISRLAQLARMQKPPSFNGEDG